MLPLVVASLMAACGSAATGSAGDFQEVDAKPDAPGLDAQVDVPLKMDVRPVEAAIDASDDAKEVSDSPLVNDDWEFWTWTPSPSITFPISAVEVTISGPALSDPITIPLVRVVDTANTWGGALGRLPVGSDYVFSLRAFDAQGSVRIAGVTTGVVIAKGQTVNVTIDGFEVPADVDGGADS